MKTLVFINGPMGVGKTAVGRALLERLTPGVYLDGDWCWCMNPFLVTDETKSMVLDNITAMLSRFLACPELDYVIFGWVMHQSEIAQSILDRLNLSGVRVLRYTLLCSEQTLRQRIEADTQAGVRSGDALERSLSYLPLYGSQDALERSLSYLPLYGSQDTIKIMTDGRSVRETAEIIQKNQEEVNP